MSSELRMGWEGREMDWDVLRARRGWDGLGCPLSQERAERVLRWVGVSSRCQRLWARTGVSSRHGKDTRMLWGVP